MKLTKTTVSSLSAATVKWVKEFSIQHNLSPSAVISLVLERAEQLEWENHYTGYRVEHLWN